MAYTGDSVTAAAEGFQDYMGMVFGGCDAELEPPSALLAAFCQRLHTLDSPEPLSAVLSHGAWPPADVISSSGAAFQLALHPSPNSGTSGGVPRKRKGESSLADRGRPPRKAKGEGVRAGAELLHAWVALLFIFSHARE